MPKSDAKVFTTLHDKEKLRAWLTGLSESQVTHVTFDSSSPEVRAENLSGAVSVAHLIEKLDGVESRFVRLSMEEGEDDKVLRVHGLSAQALEDGVLLTAEKKF